MSDCSHVEPFINLVVAITYSVGADNNTTHSLLLNTNRVTHTVLAATFKVKLHYYLPF